MKRKMIAVCTSIAALHLVIGGAVMLGGCTGVQEDEPMPRGARIPRQTVKPAEFTETQNPPALVPETAPATNTPAVETPVVVDTPAVETPVVVEPPVVEVPAKPVPAPVVKAPQKGDAAPAKKIPHRANDIEYVVKKNDTYWGIARKFGVSMRDLEAYNAIPAKKLRPGMKIVIPATGKKITKPVVRKNSVKVKKSYAPIPADGIYIVKKNDSFSKIASKFGLRAADIAEYNNLPLSKAIQPNQKLKLPPRRKSSAKNAAKPAVKDAVAPATAPANTPAVQPADLTEPAPLDEQKPAAPAADTTAPAAPAAPAVPETPAAPADDPFVDATPPAA